MQQTSIDEPTRDRMIDSMIDPLGKEQMPSLGFEHEIRGSYFIQVTVGDTMVTAWKTVGGIGADDIYTLHVYKRNVFNGAESWGSAVGDRYVCNDLIQVQAVMHSVFTSGGNDAMGC